MTRDHVRLRDGRLLGFAEFGDPAGRPLLFFHGFPGSRLEAALADSVARNLGVRLVAPDRPGYGLSDFKPRRRILDWPDDVSDLAGALGFDRFGLVGVSGGGPYALACAIRIPERLDFTGIVCGLGPMDRGYPDGGAHRALRPALLLARRAPAALLPLFDVAAWSIRRDPERFLKRFTAAAPEPDRRVLGDAAVRSVLLESSREAFRQGADGPALDLTLYNTPWGFDPGDIGCPVRFWHGERDTTVPVSMGRRLAQRIAHAELKVFPDEGHFSLPVNRMGEILGALLGGA